jgi:hypothetical protein
VLREREWQVLAHHFPVLPEFAVRPLPRRLAGRQPYDDVRALGSRPELVLVMCSCQGLRQRRYELMWIARPGVPHAEKYGRTLGTFCTES